MRLLDLLQNLPLAAMFVLTLAVGLALSWAILLLVRLAIRGSGFDPVLPLPIRDTLIGAISAFFALMMAFSAAGIWNDTSRAATAVQQESNALENVLALARGLPPELSEKIREGVNRYGRQVIDDDWPAMIRRVSVDDPIYDAADQILVDLIHTLALEQGRIAAVPTVAPLLGQIVEARSASWHALRWPTPASHRRSGSPGVDRARGVDRYRALSQPSFRDAGGGDDSLYLRGSRRLLRSAFARSTVRWRDLRESHADSAAHHGKIASVLEG